MAKQLPKQLQGTVDWIKRNTLVVVFCGVAVAAPIGSYLAADVFSAGVREEASKRSRTYSEISSALNAKTDISLAGAEPIQLDGPPTQEVVAQFRELMTGFEGDADKVYVAAVAHNRGASRAPVVADSKVFPDYVREFAPASKVRAQFVDALNARYEELLKSARAGSPPSAAELDEQIKIAKARFIQGEARVESAEKLSAEQREQLAVELRRARIFECEKAAAPISFYADLGSFSVPKKSDPAIVGLFQKSEDMDAQDRFLFDLQWQYWIASDVVRAFAAVNGTDESVLRSPLKRLVRLAVLPADNAPAKPAGEASAMGAEGMGDPGAAPADGAAAAAPTGGDEGPMGPPDINPAADAGRDYAKRFTGRVSNAVYDVRTVELTFVAETAKLGKVFDALAAQNFMTIVDARLEPADAFAAARLGFIYGAEPVSIVTATMESIWLREVTAPMMPRAVRTAYGIASKPMVGDQPADGSAEAAPDGSAG